MCSNTASRSFLSTDLIFYISRTINIKNMYFLSTIALVNIHKSVIAVVFSVNNIHLTGVKMKGKFHPRTGHSGPEGE